MGPHHTVHVQLRSTNRRGIGPVRQVHGEQFGVCDSVQLLPQQASKGADNRVKQVQAQAAGSSIWFSIF